VARDENVRHCADSGNRFGKHELHETRILLRDVGKPLRLGSRRHGRQIDKAVLGLGYDLLRDDENILYARRQ
jgi:hypothetical protein